jgi:hypothetical protein
MRLTPRSSLPLLLLALLTALPAAARVTGSFERTLQVSGPVELRVETGAGSITVRTGGASTVRVVAQIRAGTTSAWFTGGGNLEERVRRIEQNPPVEQSGNTIRIGRMVDPELTRNISISYDITVPAETRLESSTGSGSQSIAGVRGPVRASTGSGRLEVFNVASEVRASTGSGSIELDKIQGPVRASTGSGSIRAQRLDADLHARTGSGSIRVDGASGQLELNTGSGSVTAEAVRGALRVRTGSGGIRIQGTPEGQWDLHAGSGGIRLQLPCDRGFTLDARSSSGSVSVNHPIDIQHQYRQRELRGQVRGGGPAIVARTGSGSVTVN